MNYTITYNNLHVEDSYQTKKAQIEPFLNSAKAIHPWSEVWKRSLGSIKREWATHTLLYNLHLFRSHTKDVDINYPQKWYVTFVYNVFGSVALLFIK